MGYFKIQTKQTEFLNNTKLKDFKDALDNVSMFDIIPPFKVFDEVESDKTQEFLTYAENAGYIFIDKKKVLKLLPKELKDIMKKRFQKSFLVNDLSIKLVYPDDIKSIKEFYELWNKGLISIGKIENMASVIVVKPSEEKCPIFYIKENEITQCKLNLLSEDVISFFK